MILPAVAVLTLILSVRAGPPYTGCPKECMCSSREAIKVTNQHQVAMCSDMPTSNLSSTINTLTIINAELGNISETTVQHSFQYLTNLDITACGITLIEPGALDDAPQLLVLHLSQNSIREILPGTFSKCRRLRKLYLDKNYLQIVDEGAFSKLDSLTYLNLEGNRLQHIPTKLPPSLTELNLSNNQIGPSITPLLHQVNLKTLDLCGNPLSELPTNMFNGTEKLQALCVGTLLPKGTHIKLLHLANLTLANEEKGVIKLDGTTAHEISLMKTLRSLSISYYQVEDLTFLNNLTQLLDLTLKHVSVSSTINIQAAFKNKEFLNTLILESSEEICKELLADTQTMKGLRHLTKLHLSDDNISTLKHTSMPDNKYLSIDISHNPLHCDCHLKWLTYKTLLYTEDTYCDTPHSHKGKKLTEVISTLECNDQKYFPTTNSSGDSEYSGHTDETTSNNHNTLYIVLGVVFGILIIAGVVFAVVYTKFRKRGSSTITPGHEHEEPQQLHNVKQKSTSKDYLLKK